MIVWVCTGCGRGAFPRRLLCPDCGGGEWTEAESEGVVEEVTVLRRGPGRTYEPAPSIGSVRLDLGPLVVARLEAGTAPGDRIRLRLDGGAPTMLGGDA